MATITKEIKDEFVVAIAKRLGFAYNPDKPPPFEDHLAAIQSAVDNLIDPLYEGVVLDDPAVIAKKAEYDVLVEQKIADAKPSK